MRQENQATDRAYRIGQDKAVFVYKLIVENSIEEQIIKLQEKKKALQAGIYKGNEDKSNKFDGEELVELLKLQFYFFYFDLIKIMLIWNWWLQY